MAAAFLFRCEWCLVQKQRLTSVQLKLNYPPRTHWMRFGNMVANYIAVKYLLHKHTQLIFLDILILSIKQNQQTQRLCELFLAHSLS